MSGVSKFDTWLGEDGPAAIVLREHLTPVEGEDGVFFPATFAASEDKTFPGGYNIDVIDEKTNVCLVDSIGSQANRVEPIFGTDLCAGLVPQVTIDAGSRQVSLLEAGHRAGDAIVRCSSLRDELSGAFREVLRGNAEPLARIAPTSLVFGAWDSRDTQAKLPRLFSSTIRAFNVAKLTRSAQYVPAMDYVDAGALEEPTEKAARGKYAERGFAHVPSSGAHGGVIARGGIRRDAVLSLAALRQLAARRGDGSIDAERTMALRRYVLGLALCALTARGQTYLRQGCNLVPDTTRPRDTALVHNDGTREPFSLTFEEALAFARTSASGFGVGPDRTVPFDAEYAKAEIEGEAGTKKKGKKAPAKATAPSPSA